MTTETSCHCSVCGTPFVPEFSYQTETGAAGAEDGPRHFCSLECVGESLESQGRATCDVCGKAFIVKLAAQVINHGGRRSHACSMECRAQILERHTGTNLRSLAALSRSACPPERPSPTVRSASGRQPGGRVAPSRPAGPGENPVRPLAETPVLQQTTSSAPPLRTVTPAPTLQHQAAQHPSPASTPATAIPIRQAPQHPSPAAPSATSVIGQRIDASMRKENHTIAVFNHKGGTGKTTTAVTIASGLAAKGRRVLLVDTDSQGNVGVSLGLEPEKTLYHVLVMGLDPTVAIVSSRPNLDVLASNETLAAAELYLAGRQQRDRVLANRLASIAESYDHIIVDCSPSLSLLNQNALVFSDAVLCPVACDYLSLVGVRQVLRTIKQVNRVLSHPVRLWGVLPTLYDSRARICAESYETLRQHFGERCLDPIRVASRAKEAPSQARTLFEYAPDSTAARDYMQVVERLIDDQHANRTDSAVAEGAQA